VTALVRSAKKRNVRQFISHRVLTVSAITDWQNTSSVFTTQHRSKKRFYVF